MQTSHHQVLMMKKPRSVQASIRRLCICFSVLLFLVTFAFSFFSIREKAQEEINAIRYEIGSYASTFENELSAQAAFNLDYITNDSDVQILSLNRYPGPSRVSIMYNVTQVLSRRSNSYCINVLYDKTKDQIFTSPLPFPSIDRSLDDSILLRAFVTFSSQLTEAQLHTWQLFSFSGTNYLIFASQRNRLILTTVFSVDDFFLSLPRLYGHHGIRLLLTDDKQILSGNDKEFDEDTIAFILSASKENVTLRRSKEKTLVSQPISLTKLSLRLCHITDNNIVETTASILMVTIALLGFFLLFAALLNRYLARFMLFPLQEIKVISKLAEENKPFIPATNSLPVEYNAIRSSLFALAAKLEKEHQAQQAYINEKEHALLQYYQLQTRSHFFINCLKSLYSMLELHREEQMKKMIIAFSNHIRNTFQDSLQLIPLSQELDEVTSYHTILMQDDTMPLLLDMSVPDTLLNVLVPPLVIQSFLENTHKHSVPNESFTVFVIRASIVIEHDKEYLQLHLSDNGSGYLQEKLAALNAPPEGAFDAHNVGINNLKRRINLLFHGEGRIAFVNLPSGGACTIISFPSTYKR